MKSNFKAIKATARLCDFSYAATELHASQSAISCHISTHEIAHLYLMPGFDAIQAKLGQKVMTFEYDDINNLLDSRIEIKLACQLNSSSVQD